MKNQNSKIKLSINEQNNSKNMLQKKDKLTLKDAEPKNQNQSNQIKKDSKIEENQHEKNNNQSQDNKNCGESFKNFWSNKLKRYIAIGVISTVILAVVIIAVVVSVTKKSDSNKDKDKGNNNEFEEGKDKDNNESSEPELINPDCAGVCDKPYDIKVYSDSKLKSKLKECNYQENTELFNFVLEAIKRHNILRACHNAQPLMFNCEILKISQDYAETQPSGHAGTRFNGQWMGENLFWSWGKETLTGSYVVDDWYEEIKNYNFDTGNPLEREQQAISLN